MKATLILGSALVVMGAAVLACDLYTYRTIEEILQIGLLTAIAERTPAVSLPPILGWLLVGGGACALAFGVWSRKN